MASAAGLLAVIDDITAILDDVASMAKVTAQKTSGVLGDDIALGAQQAQSKVSERELPIVWQIFKGSLINKAILIPVTLIISIFVPILVTIALVLGGLYLCFEGFEKVHEHFSKKHPEEAIKDSRSEEEKVKGAIKTDMVLSLEVIVLSLGIVAAAPLMTQIGTLILVGIGMSVLVYSLIAFIIRMDDMGLALTAKYERGSILNKFGISLLISAPRIMQLIGIIGTVAMFTVGGGILLHTFHLDLNVLLPIIPNFWATEFLFQLTSGLLIGLTTFILFETIHYIKRMVRAKS